MGCDVIMPALGMSQDTGKILRWLKAAGDPVARGEIIAEIETDKATFDLEAPAPGVLGERLAEEGADVPVGAVIATVRAPGEQPEPASAAKARDEARRAPRLAASPKARRLARERGVELASITGTGPGGAVVVRDLPAEAPLSGLRQTAIAVTQDNLDHGDRPGSGTMAAWHAFVTREIDATSLIRWHLSLQRRVTDRLDYQDLYMRVVAEALSGQAAREAAPRRVDIGFSAVTGGRCQLFRIDGAEGLEVEEIADRRADLVTAGRTAAGLTGTAITIHDAGAYAVDAAAALLEDPAVPVLSFGRVADRVVAVNGTPTVRPTVQMIVSFDSRAVDSAWAAALIQEIANLLEEPLSLLA